MQTNIELLIPVFFKVLIAFIIINMIINFFLLLTKQLRIYKFLSFYWPVLLCVYYIQATFQDGNLPIIYAYSVNIVACSIFASIGFEVVRRRFPFEKYILYFIPFYPLTYFLNQQGFSFVVVAMPFAIATATPLIHAFYYVNIVDRKKTTPLQKFLACIYFLQAIHCINFALFRMAEGAQAWGWLVAYGLYDLAAILLPAIALEEASNTENERLTGLVEARTSELNNSLKENESLLKVVLHDISSPLMTMRFYLHYLKITPENEEMIEKTKKSHSAMEKIILEVKNIYGKQNKKDKLHLQPVCVEQCFHDVSFIFAQKLEQKNIDLVFVNITNGTTKVLADQTTLTHSVISNLVSNSLKFSYPNSQIRVSVKEQNENIVLEVLDQGPGISEEVIELINREKDLVSSEGTYGEIGTGFGLSIVKSFVDSYGGQIEFISKPKIGHPNNHGTCIRITLLKA
jgi:signal transduction histidine kinase